MEESRRGAQLLVDGFTPDRADAVVMAFAESAKPLVAVTFGR